MKNFIELTDNGKKFLLNINHIIEVHSTPTQGASITLTTILDGYLPFDVEESYKEVLDKIKEAQE